MGVWSKVLARICLSVSMVVLVISTFVFIASDIKPLFWTGILLLLYLMDRFVHRGQSEKSIFRLPSSGRANVTAYIMPRSIRYMVAAHDKALIAKGNFFVHLALVLMDNKGVQEALIRLDVKPDEFKAKLMSYLQSAESDDRVAMDVKLEKLAYRAFEQAIKNRDGSIDPVDLFAALGFIEDHDLARLFDLFEIDQGDLEKAMIFGRFSRSGFWSGAPRSMGAFVGRRRRHRIMNRAWTSRPTPNFDRYGDDLTDRARLGQIGFLIGHQDELERVLNVVSRSEKPNVLLVGEPGIGMDKIIEHLAYMISKDRVPPELFDKRLVSLDIGRMVAGAQQAELQSRIQTVFGEIYQAGNIILAVPEIHNLARTSGPKEMNASTTIIPLITTNDFPLIGTTYPKEFKQYIEPDSSFSKAFEVIRVKEVTHDEAMRILIHRSLLLERQHRIKITFGAVKKAVELAARYFRTEPLPGSANDLLKEALASASRRGEKVLDGDDIIDIAQTRVNIPIREAKGSEADKLLNLEELIHEKLVDQEAAVKSVAQALRQYRSGLARKGGPIGSFLFVGPTGVGKTELSKILAKMQFGSEDAMVRFDMSEYQDKQSFFQFIGSPDGTMPGILTDRVLEKPYSLILLDEFEKAHPDILNLFLQVFDDGRLTDNLGRVVSFENTIIIATSNAHSAFIKEQIEVARPMEEIASDLKKKLVTFFRPELLNRFSSIVVFRNLRPEDIQKITEIQLNSLARSLQEDQGIYIAFTPEATAKIAELGYDPVFGARPLRQVISDKIKDPLSKLILSGRAARGIKVSVGVENGEVTLYGAN